MEQNKEAEVDAEPEKDIGASERPWNIWTEWMFDSKIILILLTSIVYWSS